MYRGFIAVVKGKRTI